jgi:DNA-binding NarL/FixJ family response regulator
VPACLDGTVLLHGKETTRMSLWGVQLVIGKLVTDGVFRQRFELAARESLTQLCEQGLELSNEERSALLEMDSRLWEIMATYIDVRLRPAPISKVTQATLQETNRVLTERERQVLRGVFEGRTNKQIAATIGVSESAVKATLQHLFRKTRVRTRAQLVRVVVDGSLGAVERHCP